MTPKNVKIVFTHPYVQNIFLLVLAFFVFYPSLNAKFVGDNINQILNIKEGFWGQSYGYFRPVSILFLWLDKVLWNTEAFGYHLTNLLLHLINTLLVYLISRTWIRDNFFNFTAALIFLLHPIHAMNIFWISGRSDMICAIFFLLSFYFFLKYYHHNKVSDYWISVTIFLVSLLAKEMAISLPLIFIAYVLIYSATPFKNRIIKSLKLTLPVLIITCIYLITRFVVLPGQALSNTLHTHTAFPHLMKNMAAFAGLLVIPGGHIQIAGFLRSYPAVFLISAIISGGFGLYLIYVFRKLNHILFFIMFILLSLLPVIRLVMRWYLYIPSIGFSLLTAFLIFQLTKNIKFKKWMRGTVVLMISIMYLYFVQIEQIRWIQNGQLAEQLSKRIARKLMVNNVNEVLFLNNIAEQGETPVLIFGLHSFVNLAANSSFDNPNKYIVHTVSNVSLAAGAPMNNIITSRIDSNLYQLQLSDPHSAFDFPMNAELISQKKILTLNDRIEQEFAVLTVRELNKQNKATQLTIALKQNPSLPVMYFSEGKLHLDFP